MTATTAISPRITVKEIRAAEPKIIRGGFCTAPKCDSPVHALGLCAGHYRQARSPQIALVK